MTTRARLLRRNKLGYGDRFKQQIPHPPGKAAGFGMTRSFCWVSLLTRVVGLDLDQACLNFADFFVEVGEGGFERFAMLGMSGGLEVIHDSDAR